MARRKLLLKNCHKPCGRHGKLWKMFWSEAQTKLFLPTCKVLHVGESLHFISLWSYNPPIATWSAKHYAVGIFYFYYFFYQEQGFCWPPGFTFVNTANTPEFKSCPWGPGFCMFSPCIPGFSPVTPPTILKYAYSVSWFCLLPLGVCVFLFPGLCVASWSCSDLYGT